MAALPRARLDRTPLLRQYPTVAKAAVGCARRRVSRTAPIEVLKPRPSELLDRARMCEHPNQCRPSRKLRPQRCFHRSHVHPTSISSQSFKTFRVPSVWRFERVFGTNPRNLESGFRRFQEKVAISRRTRHVPRSRDVEKAESVPTAWCVIAGDCDFAARSTSECISQCISQCLSRHTNRKSSADQSKETRDES